MHAVSILVVLVAAQSSGLISSVYAASGALDTGTSPSVATDTPSPFSMLPREPQFSLPTTYATISNHIHGTQTDTMACATVTSAGDPQLSILTDTNLPEGCTYTFYNGLTPSNSVATAPAPIVTFPTSTASSSSVVLVTSSDANLTRSEPLTFRTGVLPGETSMTHPTSILSPSSAPTSTITATSTPTTRSTTTMIPASRLESSTAISSAGASASNKSSGVSSSSAPSQTNSSAERLGMSERFGVAVLGIAIIFM